MSLVFVLTVVVQLADHSRPDQTKERLRLRTLDPVVAAVIRTGEQQSPRFAALVDAVERSDTFVYVVRAHTLPHRMEGCLVDDGAGAGYRYLKVFLLMGLPSDRTIAVLAHELQHVREVLDAGVPIGPRALETLFMRIGSPRLGSRTGEQYDTDAAQDVERTVTREVEASRRASVQSMRVEKMPRVAAVRPTRTMLADAIREGRRRSGTFREVLDRVEQSDLILYLEVGSCPPPQSIACLSLIGATASHRFARAAFVLERSSGRTILSTFTNHLIAHIGHELQHAIEIADDRGIVDAATLAAAYGRFGFRSDATTCAYESARAIEVGKSILAELRESR